MGGMQSLSMAPKEVSDGSPGRRLTDTAGVLGCVFALDETSTRRRYHLQCTTVHQKTGHEDRLGNEVISGRLTFVLEAAGVVEHLACLEVPNSQDGGQNLDFEVDASDRRIFALTEVASGLCYYLKKEVLEVVDGMPQGPPSAIKSTRKLCWEVFRDPTTPDLPEDAGAETNTLAIGHILKLSAADQALLASQATSPHLISSSSSS